MVIFFYLLRKRENAGDRQEVREFCVITSFCKYIHLDTFIAGLHL